MFVNYLNATMKTLCNSALLIMALGLVITYSSCGPTIVEPSIEEKQLEKLSGTWVVNSSSSVTRDGVDVTSDYQNFTLTLSGTHGGTLSYSTAGRPQLSPWPASGTWTFSVNSPETTITRDPANTAEAIDIMYTVSDTDIELTFDFDKAGYEASRTKEVTGQWIFTMKAQ
jgi:hypothetical protein